MKEKQLAERSQIVDSWRQEKGDLQRLLRSSGLRCKQLEAELGRVQITAFNEMTEWRKAVRERCMGHVQNCDLRQQIKALARKLAIARKAPCPAPPSRPSPVAAAVADRRRLRPSLVSENREGTPNSKKKKNRTVRFAL